MGNPTIPGDDLYELRRRFDKLEKAQQLINRPSSNDVVSLSGQTQANSEGVVQAQQDADQASQAAQAAQLAASAADLAAAQAKLAADQAKLIADQAILDAAAAQLRAEAPVTDLDLALDSLTIWPFMASTIPGGSFAAGAVGSTDLADFAVTAKKFNDNRHHIF